MFPLSEKPNLLTLKSLNPSNKSLNWHFSLATLVLGDNQLRCFKCYDRKAQVTFRTSKCCSREGKNRGRENSKCYGRLGKTAWTSDFLFPLQPHPHPDKPPPGWASCPTRKGLISVHFGSVWLRSGPFDSVSGPFRVPWVGSG